MYIQYVQHLKQRHCHVLLLSSKEQQQVHSDVATPASPCSVSLFRPVIEREIFSVSVPLAVRRAHSGAYRPCAVLRCGIPPLRLPP